ncbi:MAG: hypothetical protein CUN50_06290, partial [Candidatus Thermofonsia Clade 1 bacterium]
DALRAMNNMMKQKEREKAANRIAAMGVPQSVVDELMGIFDDMAEGSHDKLISAIGRMIDHLRAEYSQAVASSNSNPSLRGDAQRAAAQSVLTKQIATLDAAGMPNG